MQGKDRVQTGVFLSRKTYERLRRVAFERHTPQQEIVEAALLRLLPELEAEIATASARRGG